MHKTSQHNCNICNIQDQICSHAILKCSNCEENHTANNNTCEFKISIENKTIKYSQQKNQQIIIIIIIMNLTADQSCSHAVSMSSKHAGKSERSKNPCLNLLYTH